MSTAPSAQAPDFLASYKPLHNLPPLAGLASFEHAASAGVPVEESVRRLKRHHYLLKRLHQVLVARITSEPIYELKMAFSYHAYLCAEQVTAIRYRVGEMREPPLGLDRVPHVALERLCDEVLLAPSTTELLLGVYRVLIPHAIEEIDKHYHETHPLADQPTRRLCRLALVELEEIAGWGQAAIEALIKPQDEEKADSWLNLLRDCIEAAKNDRAAAPLPFYSRARYEFDRVPRRDCRFSDPYNMGVNAEAFLYDDTKPADAKVLMMFYKRLREIDVPEMMASIISETPGKPWEYYRDMTRQLWDEARHAMMGEVGFAAAGVDWPRYVMVNFTWSLGLNTQLSPIERHAVLYFIEQGLMPKTGKRHEWEVAVQARDPLAATFQDFDWADEVLHARIGRDWYVSEMPSPKEAVDYGDQCWSKLMVNWERWRQEGLTQHRNWWPELYRAYCRNLGKAPAPDALAFDANYATTRADLKAVSGSA